jgi:hypothetical protein
MRTMERMTRDLARERKAEAQGCEINRFDRPQWKDAPDWANWLVLSMDTYWWTEKKPKMEIEMLTRRYYLPKTGRQVIAGCADNMKLEKRPGANHDAR